MGDFEKFHRVITFGDDAVVIGVEHQKFHNPDSATVSGVVAAGATHRAPKFAGASGRQRHGQVGQDRLRIGVRLATGGAEAADETLAQDPQETSGQKIGWNAQIDQAGDGAEGILGHLQEVFEAGGCGGAHGICMPRADWKREGLDDREAE